VIIDIKIVAGFISIPLSHRKADLSVTGETCAKPYHRMDYGFALAIMIQLLSLRSSMVLPWRRAETRNGLR
jgi:hypothetical protein